MTVWPLQDPLVQCALGRVLERSERQEDLGQLEATFVDPGIEIRLSNDNNQILYGRRGTGKTHVLKVLKRHAEAAGDQLPVYVDMRTLGSSSLWEDARQPAFVRVANLLSDVMLEVQNALVEYVTRPGLAHSREAFDSLDRLAEALRRSVASEPTGALQHAPAESPSSDDDDVASRTLRIVREGRPLERIQFRRIGEELQTVLHHLGVQRLVLLLDEWSGIPAELQPLLAEFIKRSFFPYPRTTVKIAAVEYRCCFGIPLSRNNVLGFELSADIASSLELDDYFVIDRDEQATVDVFADLLFRHVSAECDSQWIIRDLKSRPGTMASEADVRRLLRLSEWNNRYLESEHGIKTPADFTRAFFARPRAFLELVRAGEGVARDLMSLFQQACFEVIRRGGDQIDEKRVRHVARDWWVQNKVSNMAEPQRAVLERIVDEVVGRHRSRSFLFDRRLECSEMLRSLFDLRVIHLVKRGYIATDDSLGRQYNIYTLDYGTYVDAIGTDRAPRGDFTARSRNGHPVIVPFQDDRAIKRIVLPPELFGEARLG